MECNVSASALENVNEPRGGIRIGPRRGEVFLRLDRGRGGIGRRPPGGRERKVLD